MADKSQSFRDTLVWQKTHAFTLAVYQTTGPFPKHELFALTSQLRRAASSIPSNFVEGFRKRTKPDKLKEVSRLLQGYINGLGRNDS